MKARSNRFLLTSAGMGAVAALAVAASSSGSTSVSPKLSGELPTTYKFLGVVSGIPRAVPSAVYFDISFIDGEAHLYYLSDGVEKGIDVVDSVSGKPYGTSGAGTFVAGSIRPGEAHPTNGGPDGVAPIGNGLLAAGDGDSTLKIVQVFSKGKHVGGTVATIQTPNLTGPNLPGICKTTPADPLGVPTAGAGNGRVDELAWDSTDREILAISDASCPVLATFYSSNAPYNILGQVPLTTANGGGEQPVWDAKQGKFFVAIPSTTTNPDGVIDIFDPKRRVLTGFHPLPVGGACRPSGLALGNNENLFMACENSFLTMNAITGDVINNLPANGGDEVWYSHGSNRFYGSATVEPAVITVADADGKLVSSFPVAPLSHSIAVEPSNDHVFVPQTSAGGVQAGVSVFGH